MSSRMRVKQFHALEISNRPDGVALFMNPVLQADI